MTGSFTRGAGIALCVAAVTTLAINVFVSPQLPLGSFAVVAASPVYVVRQCLAAAVAMLLVFGIVGLHFGRPGRSGIFATLAFIVALTGAVGLFSVEWGQAFTIHDIARRAPFALDAIMTTPWSPLLVGAMIPIAAFYLGWFLLALSLLLSRDHGRLGPGLILAGFVVAPVLSFTGSFGVYAGIVASLVIGSGWFLIGMKMAARNSVLPL